MRQIPWILIDSLNEKEIVKQFKNPTDLKGGISKLEYWLSELNFPDYQQQIKFLRNLQELRSTGTGHRKGKGYEKAAGVFGLNTDNYVDVFDRILLQANAFILFLAKNFLKDWTVTLSWEWYCPKRSKKNIRIEAAWQEEPGHSYMNVLVLFL